MEDMKEWISGRFWVLFALLPIVCLPVLHFIPFSIALLQHTWTYQFLLSFGFQIPFTSPMSTWYCWQLRFARFNHPSDPAGFNFIRPANTTCKPLTTTQLPSVVLSPLKNLKIQHRIYRHDEMLGLFFTHFLHFLSFSSTSRWQSKTWDFVVIC